MRFLFLLVLSVSFLLPSTSGAQPDPVAGSTYTVVYTPSQFSAVADASQLTLLYVFDFWNVRYGTRLALWQNVLDPDTSRIHRVAMRKQNGAWKADIPIPTDAALLSWIVTDGRKLDGNGEKTWVRYILDTRGEPVMNARYYNIPFLKLAREEIGVQIREAEREVVSWPENFRAYYQYFTLLLEQAKGSPRTQERIVNRLADLEQRYGNDPGFLNMAAEIWYYVLQDQPRALEYRNRIEASAMWPQVFAMADRQGTKQGEIERATYHSQRRAELQGKDLPEFNLLADDNSKVMFPRRDGKPMVIVFWASTSEKSRSMLTALQAAAAELPAGSLTIAAVSLDLEADKAREWFAAQNLSFELLFNQGNTLHLLGVDSIPIVFFVDAKDAVRDVVVGYESGMQAALRARLAGLVR
jgi:peroxiredoxin